MLLLCGRSTAPRQRSTGILSNGSLTSFTLFSFLRFSRFSRQSKGYCRWYSLPYQQLTFSGWFFDIHEFLPGRALERPHEHHYQSFSISAGHNHAHTTWDMRKLETRLWQHTNAAHRDPLHCFCLSGDFHVSAVFSRQLQLAHIKNQRPHQKAWLAIVAPLKLKKQSNTHVTFEMLSTNHINRIVVALLASGLLHFYCNAIIFKDPVAMYAQGVSDHSPCSLTLQWKKPISSTKHHHRTDRCSHPFFQEQCSKLC